MQTQFLDTAHILYVGAFVVGLLTTVYVMLNGSVRMKADPTTIKAPPAAFNIPVVGAAATAFGAVGYLLTKYSHLDTIPTLLIALASGAAGWIGMTILMAKWALVGPMVDPHEELEELQGTVAQVSRDISPSELGEITYTFRGQPLRVPARSLSGAPVTTGTEVVIDMIQNGVADVELWSVVEQRL